MADDPPPPPHQPLAEWLETFRGSSAVARVDLRGRTLIDMVDGPLAGDLHEAELKSLGLLKMKGRRMARLKIEQLRQSRPPRAGHAVGSSSSPNVPVASPTPDIDT